MLMKGKASALMLMIVLSFSIVSVSFVHFAEANPPPDLYPTPLPIAHLYIKSDFTLTGNILNCTLEVQSDNVVIDGAGYALEGHWGYNGITLIGRSNGTIKNLKIQGFDFGISISGNSNHITIAGNTLIGTPIQIDDSSNSTIIGNTLIGCGIEIDDSSKNTIIDNNMDSSTVEIYRSNNNRVLNNYFHGDVLGSFVYLGTANCNIISTNVVTSVVSSLDRGIYLSNCLENIIIANNITGSRVGIEIAGSLSNNITGNFLYNNSDGFFIRNYMYNDSDGVRSRSGEPKIILLSEFTNKSLKVNIFSQNDVCGNKKSVRASWQIYYPVSEDLLTDWHKMPISLFGNYWSDYNGTDSNGDGVGDKPYYTTDPFYVDSHPLMVPTYIRNITITTPKIQTIDELQNEELENSTFRMMLNNFIFYGVIILIATGLILLIHYFQKRKR